MGDKQSNNFPAGYIGFLKHASLVSLINEQRGVLNDYFAGFPEVFQFLLGENQELRHSTIDLMLDDINEQHPFLIRAEDKEKAACYIERVLDLADVESDGEFAYLVYLIWKYMTSDDPEKSGAAEEQIEVEYMCTAKKYAFVLSTDSRGLDVNGIKTLQDYILDQYNDSSTLVVIQDETITDPSYLAGKLDSIDFEYDTIVHHVLDCYIFVLHDDNRFMECITGSGCLGSLAEFLNNNSDYPSTSWIVAMEYAMDTGMEPIPLNV